MIKKYLLSILSKEIDDLKKRIKENDLKIGALDRSIDHMRSNFYNETREKVNIIEWRIDNPPKHAIGDKVTTPKGSGIVCERETSYNCPEGLYYLYTIIIKNKREHFSESELK